MKRALALLPAIVLVAACPAEVKKTPIGPNPIELKLKEHAGVLAQLKLQQHEFQTALEDYEKRKSVYEQAVSTNLGAVRGGEKRAISQLQEMARDVDKIAQELIAAVAQLDEALVSRAEASEKWGSNEAKLLDFEIEVFGTRDQAAARGVVEVRYMHEMETDLRLAQKEEQQAIAALHNKEIEVWGSIGDDPEARDRADKELFELRNTVETTFAKLLDMAQRYDDAEDRVHKKIQEAAVVKNGELGTRLQLLVDRRAQAGKELASARENLKKATLLRAEKRAGEVAYDGEFAVVLSGTFKTDKQKEEFTARVAPQRRAVLDGRKRMQTEEKGVGEVRKKLVQIEAEMAELSY